MINLRKRCPKKLLFSTNAFIIKKKILVRSILAFIFQIIYKILSKPKVATIFLIFKIILIDLRIFFTLAKAYFFLTFVKFLVKIFRNYG